MAAGVLKKWNSDRGYGFIKPDGVGNDIFVHVSEFKKAQIHEPQEGDRIEFDTETGRNGSGLRAVKLTLLG